MAGLKLSACFWYLDPLVSDDVLITLKEGKFDVEHRHYKESKEVKERLKTDPPDVVISDFDLPDQLRQAIEEVMEPFLSEIPLIYLVGEKNVRIAASSLNAGVWDFVQKEQLYKLVPSVYSSQKYADLFRKRKEAEQALKESRDRYMSIFESVHDGILLFDFETRKITEYNPRVLEMFEADESDMKSLDLELYSAVDEGYSLNIVRAHIKKARDGDPVSFEWRNITKSGKRFWTLNSISVVLIDTKPYILLVTRDISEQKKLESSLTESQEHFLALAENSPDVIMHFDRQYRNLFVNGAVERHTGLSPKLFLNRTHREMGVFPEELVDLWEDSLESVFTSGNPKTVIFELEGIDKKITFEWRLYPETGISEAVQSVIGVARDITDSRIAEDALRRSEERLNMALSATNLGLWDWNLVNNEVYFSPIWFSMLGYGPDELPQKLETWTNLLHPDERDVALNAVQEVIKNREELFDIEFRLKHKEWFLCVDQRPWGKAVSFDADGNTTRLTGIHENIDERKQDELVKQVLFDISNAVNSTHSLDELYAMIRESLGRVVDTTNCFLALYNEDRIPLLFPLWKMKKMHLPSFRPGKH